jgi:hypothetical protein
MKKFLVILLITVSFTRSFAQKADINKPTLFSLGADFFLPASSYENAIIGGSAQANFFLNDKTDFTLYAGYLHYSLKKDQVIIVTDGSIVPLLIGIEYKFTPQLFGSAQAGISFFSLGKIKPITLSPGIGYKINKNLSVLLKYIQWIPHDGSTGGIRIAYTFGK